MLQQLTPVADALRQAPWVVLDVRGNSGGASHWSSELARLIWRREAVDAVRDDSWVEWRASEPNIAQLRGFLEK
ncbi:hypothetical protein ABTK13_23925, partial [Acinetobacter baumannii]